MKHGSGWVGVILFSLVMCWLVWDDGTHIHIDTISTCCACALFKNDVGDGHHHSLSTKNSIHKCEESLSGTVLYNTSSYIGMCLAQGHRPRKHQCT